MIKTIKLEERTYHQLDQLRGKRETFSDAVATLLLARLKVLELSSVLEGQLKYREWQREQLENRAAK